MKDYLADAKAWIAKNEDIEASTIEYSIEQLAHKLQKCPDLAESVKSNIRETIKYLNRELGLEDEASEPGQETARASDGEPSLDTSPLVDLNIEPATTSKTERREALNNLLSTGLIKKGCEA